jgi:hypothetical protein
VVRDPSLPALAGRYVYGDFCTGELRTADLTAGTDRALNLVVPALSSFGEDAAGRIYAASLAGPVFRLRAGHSWSRSVSSTSRSTSRRHLMTRTPCSWSRRAAR